MSRTETEDDREGIKFGDAPLRYEYGRENENIFSPSVKDQLAYVEEEKYSSYFQLKTCTGHDKGSEPSLKEAQETAIGTLRDEGSI
ncbi:hypothetical protein [Salinibacter ruber]|jgi:hypothetical protein|uniref:hypothetical protein n=1 Tax=Salinibacter ruber TaxID=146919 RepID=UPI00160BE8EB|nr:hypothetical protein [Salinibacter ruber]MBB4089595.1 hypothetical protein [Salinibacter ruber]